MPLNRHALIRYYAIDACLRRHSKKWSLTDLIEACSLALEEKTGTRDLVSKRTIQRDLEYLRKDWNAPIEVEEQKYYYYSDLNFSLERVPLTEEDAMILLEIRDILHSFQEFDQLSELDRIIAKVERSLLTQIQKFSGAVQIDHIASGLGREYLPVLFRSILEAFPLQLDYQSFRQDEPESFAFSSYLLKAYNSRWYVLGYHHNQMREAILALDRIKKIDQTKENYHPPIGLDIHNFFNNRIGVSGPSNSQIESVLLWVSPDQIPYVRSRPWHASQKIVSDDPNGLLISLDVILNYELVAKILSFGDGIVVKSPEKLRSMVLEKLESARTRYLQ